MIIEAKVCCGVDAQGPKHAPTSVKVITDIVSDPLEGGSAIFIAGFPKENYFDKYSNPTCYQEFKWPGTATLLKFTDDFALEYFGSGISKTELR